jgi:hypothetical protein
MRDWDSHLGTDQSRLIWKGLVNIELHNYMLPLIITEMFLFPQKDREIPAEKPPFLVSKEGEKWEWHSPTA